MHFRYCKIEHLYIFTLFYFSFLQFTVIGIYILPLWSKDHNLWYRNCICLGCANYTYHQELSCLLGSEMNSFLFKNKFWKFLYVSENYIFLYICINVFLCKLFFNFSYLNQFNLDIYMFTGLCWNQLNIWKFLLVVLFSLFWAFYV